MQTLKTRQTYEAKETKDFASRLSNIISELNFMDEDSNEFSLSSYIFYLLRAAEGAEPKVKAEIENNIVKLGTKAVPHLIDSMIVPEAVSRGLAAMAIIRIGFESVELLQDKADEFPEFSWVADYIINEIKGTQIPITA